VIEFRSLAKQYGAFQPLAPLNLSVSRGEVFGFLGPNGAGKTTTIRLMMGILVPSDDAVLIDGLDCRRQSVEVKRRVGYLPDSAIFYDYLRGREILQFVGEMHGFSSAEARNRTERLLGELQLREVANEFAVNYSMGMKKKLALACALIHDPAVLILDEPTNDLDPRASRDVQDRLRRSAADGTTIFLSTHLPDMADRLCSRVGIIHRGELVWHWFFAIQLAVLLTDVPETLVKGAEHLRTVPKEYPFLIAALLAISVVAMLSSRRRVHEVLCLAWLLGTLGYTFFIPLMSRIGGH
jgi:ABC-2 type transport system ATP-binding protein